jgi:polar amino acid transport system substrate-binding protein
LFAVPTDELAPGGTLRVAVNLSNTILVQREGADGEVGGVAVLLARELGQRVGLPVEIVPFKAAADLFAALAERRWDVAFLADEPARAAQIDFTSPYVMIEGTYLARVDAPFRAVGEVDRTGVTIAVGRGSAYDLYLSRTITQARILRSQTAGGTAAIDLFLAEKLDVAAGLRPQLAAYARDVPGLRVLKGRFMEVGQAVGLPKGRPCAAAFVRQFIDEVKASGFVAEALRRTGQDVTVARA